MERGGDGLRDLPEARRWQGQVQLMAVVAGIIRRKEVVGPEYLLIKRIQEPYLGNWALVGGRWVFGETLAEAVMREVREETG
jgi:ADP-ribose pyrophosphatase YjhB (NUDIX family)